LRPAPPAFCRRRPFRASPPAPVSCRAANGRLGQKRRFCAAEFSPLGSALSVLLNIRLNPAALCLAAPPPSNGKGGQCAAFCCVRSGASRRLRLPKRRYYASLSSGSRPAGLPPSVLPSLLRRIFSTLSSAARSSFSQYAFSASPRS